MADHLQEPAEVDPRKALAERYMQRARAELDAKDTERPKPRRADVRSTSPMVRWMSRVVFSKRSTLSSISRMSGEERS